MMRSISLILAFLIIIIPANVYSDTPKVADIRQGQKAPYNGVLYNYEANAVLLTVKDKGQLECTLQLDRKSVV